MIGTRGMGGTVTEDMTEGVEAAVEAGVELLDIVLRDVVDDATAAVGRLLVGEAIDTEVA